MNSSSLITSLRNIIARPLTRNILKVLTGNIGGNLLNIVAMMWLGVALRPEAFGLLTTLQYTMLLLAQLSDFGLNTTIIKYYRDYVTQGRQAEAEALMRRSLWLRLALIGAVAAGCALAAGPIARGLLKEPGSANLFRVACAGALTAALWAFCQAAMQARQQFGLYAVLTTLNHALRLALVAVFIFIGRLDLTAAMIILAAVPLAGALSSVRLWPRHFWTARMESATLRRQLTAIFHFSKWIFLSSVITTIIMRLDVYLLTLLKGKEAVGQYGMAANLAQGVPLITAAISTVLLPKLAAVRRRDEIRRIIGGFIKLTPLLAIGVACVICAAHLLLPHVFGERYRPAIVVFDALVIGSSLSIILNPLSFFCLAFERASWLTWMNLAQLLLSVAFNLLLIPWLGALGAGVTAVVVRAFGFVFLALATRRILELAE